LGFRVLVVRGAAMGRAKGAGDMADLRVSIEREGSRLVVALRSKGGGGATLAGSVAAIAALSASLAAAVTADTDVEYTFTIGAELELAPAPAALSLVKGA